MTFSQHISAIYCLLLLYGCTEPTALSYPHVHIYYDEAEVDYEDKVYAEVHFNLDNYVYSDLTRIKMRGGWSRQYPKKNFTLNLQADPNVPKLSEDNDWVLTASYIDKTMIRHVLSYTLFKRLTNDSLAAPNSTYVELYINHDYNGLYLLHPRVDRSYLNLSKNGALFKDPPIFFKNELPAPEKADNPFHQKYPDLDRLDLNSQLAQIRDAYIDADLCSSNDWQSLFDFKTIISWHLQLLVTHGSDGLLKNFYLYKANEKDPFKICIWDYDHSFGRDGDYELNQDTTILDLSRNWLLDGLMECDDYRRTLSNEYEKQRSRGILQTEQLIGLADSIYLANHQQILRNGERWAWDAEYYSDKNNSDQEMKILRTFISTRLDMLDAYFSNITRDTIN
jgi:hypothetical protein